MGAFFFKKIFMYSFIWLHPVLVAAISSIFVAGRGLFCGGMWDLVPWSGIEPRPWALGDGVLAAGLPGGPSKTQRKKIKQQNYLISKNMMIVYLY